MNLNFSQPLNYSKLKVQLRQRLGDKRMRRTQSIQLHRQHFGTRRSILAGVVFCAFLCSAPQAMSFAKKTDVTGGAQLAEAGTPWNPDNCANKFFPLLKDPHFFTGLSKYPKAFANGMIRGWATARVYCSRQWDTATLRKIVEILDERKLLAKHWGNQLVTQSANAMERNAPNQSIADFFTLVDPLTLVWVSGHKAFASILGDYQNGLAKNFSTFPPVAAWRSAAKRLNFQLVVTTIDHPPVAKVLRDRAPRITIIRDIPKPMRLEDLARSVFFNYNNGPLAGQSTIKQIPAMFTKQIGKQWPITQASEMREVLFLAFYTQILLDNRKMVSKASAQDNFLPLSSLEIHIRKTRKNWFCSGKSVNRQTRAYYCPKDSRIVISSNLFKVGQSDSHDLVDPSFFYKSMPPALFHELAHYFYRRRTSAAVRFLAEGEATAAGEMASQILRASANAAAEDKSEMARRFFEHLDRGMSETRAREFMSFFEQYYRTTPYTLQQKKFLCLASNTPLSARKLGVQLRNTPLQFNSQKNRQLAYAYAWSIYHVDRLNKMFGDRKLGWHEFLEKVARDLSQAVLPSNDGVKRLKSIAIQINQWSRTEIVAKKINCR